MRQEMRKIIIPIAVVMLFLGLTLSPVISAESSGVKQHKLTILMQGVTDDNYKIQIMVSQEQLDEFNASMDDFMVLVDSAMDENSPDGTEISVSEWEDIETSVNGLIDLIETMVGEDFPAGDTKIFINSVVSILLSARYYLRQPVFSVGIGITWIPFYDYETFLGKLIKPVFIQHFLGFSATFKLNPFVLGFTCFKYGLHRIRTFFFEGLLINFGDLGIDRGIGPQILIGFGFFTGFA